MSFKIQFRPPTRRVVLLHKSLLRGAIDRKNSMEEAHLKSFYLKLRMTFYACRKDQKSFEKRVKQNF